MANTLLLMKGVIMAKKITLPKTEPEKYLVADRPVFIRKEWVIDNAYLERIRPELAQRLVQSRLVFFAESAKIEAKHFEELAKILK